jgi:thymidylate synthase (FAD)
MILRNPESKVIGLVPLFDGTNMEECLKEVERHGRVCYKSESKITEESYIRFCDNIIKRKHFPVLEFSNMVLCVDVQTILIQNTRAALSVILGKYINIVVDKNKVYIGGSLRAWLDILMKNIVISNDLTSIPDQYFLISKSIEFIKRQLQNYNSVLVIHDNADIPPELRRVSAFFIHDRAFTHELIRHRPPSFLQESQRYVRYDDGITFITPYPFRKKISKSLLILLEFSNQLLYNTES